MLFVIRLFIVTPTDDDDDLSFYDMMHFFVVTSSLSYSMVHNNMIFICTVQHVPIINSRFLLDPPI